MTIASVLVAGFAATLAMTTVMRGASELRLTRMDFALLLGTAMSDRRRTALAIGYVLHFIFGILFAFAYTALFAVVGTATWWVGALAGALQAVFNGTVLVNVLLPVVHPRMATPDTAANEIALVEPPGFLMLNYGRSTFVVMLVAQISYGAIVGAIVRL
jgi:hypothetical protein